MTWLLWRQHRLQMLLIAIALALFATAVVLSGNHIANVYASAERTCSANGTCSIALDPLTGFGAMLAAVNLTIAVPVLFGVFGAVLISRETELSTNVLVWTQSVTRRRWIIAKVLAAIAITLVTTAAVSALATWWSGTENSLNGNRFEGAQFDTQNLAPIAFALFAVALGLAAGCLFRRPFPAIATTVGVYAVVRVLVSVYVRPHWMTPVTRSVPFGQEGGVPSGSMTLGDRLVDPAGHSVRGPGPVLPRSCGEVIDKITAGNCLSKLGYHDVVKYQPASRYWHFQLAEAGLFVALAAVLVAIAVVYTLRRDA